MKPNPELIAKQARISCLRMTHVSKASHIGSCLSVVDILTVAYIEKFSSPSVENYDVILSKGHAAAALYATLSALGKLNYSLDSYCKDSSPLYGHVNHHASKHIPLSTGSLGHGLPFAVGVALAKKINGIQGKTLVIISDGECNEGTTWESALLANHHNLSNLIVIIDRNGIQSLGDTENVLQLESLIDKWKSFGWATIEIDGHNISQIKEEISQNMDKPLCLIAKTIKGKGVDFMENELAWHYKSPSETELIEAIQKIESNI